MPLFDAPTLLAYLVAATLLVIVPGPGSAWIIAQSLAGGTRRGLMAGLGLETATLIHALAAGLGLSALIAASALAFDTIKYAGAAYLVWLGVRAWRERGDAQPPGTDQGSGRGIYLRSVLTGVLNPKAALFFLAFMPQFVHPGRGQVWLQFLVLGMLLTVIGFANSTLLSITTGRLGRRVSTHPRMARWRQRALGALFVGLGLRLAMQQRG
jgi:threonine/homoserine/homoserine lactone efflux protein